MNWMTRAGMNLGATAWALLGLIAGVAAQDVPRISPQELTAQLSNQDVSSRYGNHPVYRDYPHTPIGKMQCLINSLV